MEKSPNNFVIVGSYRTPITKAKKGAMAHLKNNEILYEHFMNTLRKTNIKPSDIVYVCLGNVLSEMNGTIDARHSCLRANIPVQVPIMTVNRECASGLESFEIAKNMLLLDKCKVALVGGFESMTMHSIPVGNLNDHNDSELAKGCLMSMIETSDKVVVQFKLSRDEIDDYTYKSHLKAFESVSSGLFKDEILPIDGIETDDCFRKPDREKMRTLKVCYNEGVTTAGNASQLSDGCSLALMMKRSVAEELKQKIMGVLLDYFVIGIDPSIMGIGPSYAIPLKIEDIDVFFLLYSFQYAL